MVCGDTGFVLPVQVFEASKSNLVVLAEPALASDDIVLNFPLKAPPAPNSLFNLTLTLSIYPVIFWVPLDSEKEFTVNLTLGKLAWVIVLLLLPPVCLLAPLPLVPKRNLPSIFCQVVPRKTLDGLVELVVK